MARWFGALAGVSCALLLASARLARSEEPPSDALLASVPFHPDTPSGRVVIDLAPEGSRPFVFELDTGASATVVTPREARRMGVSVRALKSSAYRRRTLLGRNLAFWVDTSSSDTGARSFEYALLGADFLDDYVVEIDYPGRCVRFYDRRKLEVPRETSVPGEGVIAFRRSGARILVPFEVDGRTVQAMLDTGSTGTLLSGPLAREAGIGIDGLPELSGVTGVLGPVDALVYESKSLRFAGFELPGQPVAIVPRGLYNQGGPTDSVLGSDVLSHFVLRIDYARKRIWLRRAEGELLTFFGTPYVGSAVASGTSQTAPTPEPLFMPSAPPSPEEVEEQDAARLAEWKREQDTRRFAETAGGGFVLVDGPRLREGPRDGETWYTYEEMMAIRAERERAGRSE